MEITYSDVTDLVWVDAEHTQIDCTVNFAHLPEDAVRFTASPNDTTAHGRKIFAECLEGKYGDIAEYVPPPPLPPEILAINIRTDRDLCLSNSDWTQLPDVPQSVKDAWAPYRQALRDITQQPGFPTEVVWPAAP